MQFFGQTAKVMAAENILIEQCCIYPLDSFSIYIMSPQRLLTKIDFIQIVNNPRRINHILFKSNPVLPRFKIVYFCPRNRGK